MSFKFVFFICLAAGVGSLVYHFTGSSELAYIFRAITRGMG